MDIINSNHIIKTKIELYQYCDFADAVLKFALNLSVKAKITWNFDIAYCNWEKDLHFIIFRSIDDDDYVLSLKVAKNENDKYGITIQKKVP